MNDVIEKMSESQGRFLLISGASGSGKSSLVAAGLWQALIKEGRLPGSTSWKWERIQPSDEVTPWLTLASGLKHAFPKISARPKELANQWAKTEKDRPGVKEQKTSAKANSGISAVPGTGTAALYGSIRRTVHPRFLRRRGR